MKYMLRLDYVTMNFEAGSMNANLIRDNLASPGIDFCWKRIGLKETSPLHSPFGVFFNPQTGFSERPHCVQISGVGCTKFERTLPYLRKAAPNHISRIDFAFDVVLTHDQWKEYIKYAFSSSLDSDRKQRKFSLTGSGLDMTIYIGARRSERFFRIYNKTLQDPNYVYYDESGEPVTLSNNEYVIRYEVEFHRFRRTLRGEKVLIDPTWMFDSYYSDSSAAVCSEVLKYWSLYGDACLLPPDFENIELECLSTTHLFCCDEGESFSEAVSIFDHAQAVENLHEMPRSYQNTVDYVFDKFSPYIPIILSDYNDCQIMMQRARIKFGWPYVLKYEYTSNGFVLRFENVNDVDFCDCDDVTPFDSYYSDFENLNCFDGG